MIITTTLKGFVIYHLQGYLSFVTNVRAKKSYVTFIDDWKKDTIVVDVQRTILNKLTGGCNFKYCVHK